MSDSRKSRWRKRSPRNYAMDLLHAQAWKDRQRRPCASCGTLKGYDNKGELCTRCRNAATRNWTGEAVIAAIQRFYQENGRPPTSTEWIRANPEKGYPARSSVYGGHNPFDSWSDAIVAAGFPRPKVGRYQDESKRGRQAAA